MLSKLFKRKPRLNDPDPAVRERALADLLDEQQELLTQFASSETDQRLRRQALQRLNRLETIAGFLDDPELGSYAAARIAELAPEDSDSGPAMDPRVLVRRIAACHDAATATQLLAALEDANDIASCINQCEDTAVRRALADSIWQEPTLHAMVRLARGHDKRVLRLARDRLQALKDLRATQARDTTRAAELIERVGHVDPADPHFAAKIDALEQQWQAIAEKLRASDVELARFGAAASEVAKLDTDFRTARPEPPAPVEVTAEPEGIQVDSVDPTVDPAPARQDELFGDLLGELQALADASARRIAELAAASEPPVEADSGRRTAVKKDDDSPNPQASAAERSTVADAAEVATETIEDEPVDQGEAGLDESIGDRDETIIAAANNAAQPPAALPASATAVSPAVARTDDTSNADDPAATPAGPNATPASADSDSEVAADESVEAREPSASQTAEQGSRPKDASAFEDAASARQEPSASQTAEQGSRPKDASAFEDAESARQEPSASQTAEQGSRPKDASAFEDAESARQEPSASQTAEQGSRPKDTSAFETAESALKEPSAPQTAEHGQEPAGAIHPMAAPLETSSAAQHGEQAVAPTQDAGHPATEASQQWRMLRERWNVSAERSPPAEAEAAQFREMGAVLTASLGAEKRVLQVAHRARSLFDTDPLADFEDRDPNTEAEHQAFWRRRQAVDKALTANQRLIQALDWPDTLPAPGWLQPLVVRAEREAAFRQRADAMAAQMKSAIEAGLDEIEARLEAGNSAEAATMQEGLTALLRHLPPHEQKRLSGVAHARTAALREFRQWQTFAELPKRESLCESMAALVESELQPPDLAARIKSLRQEWNALGRTRSAAERRLMDRFNQAAETAFEPCKAYFAQQADERQRNLEQREAICAQLEAFVDSNDWANADYRAAEQILRTARDEWRRHHPVDRAAGKTVEDQFQAVTDRLYALLKAEWDRNVAAKEALVETATAAAASDTAVDELIELVKRQQQQWKAIGPTPRRPDQKLWKAFRSVCDEVFARRETDRDEREAAIEATVTAARAIEAELGAESIDFAAIRDIEQRIDALGQLPGNVHGDIRSALESARNRASESNRQAQAEKRRGRLNAVAELDRSLAAVERANGDLDAWHADAGAELPLFAARIERLQSLQPTAEQHDDGAALHRLVIEAEIIAELDSPAADEALRMQVQVERLRTGMTNRADTRQTLDGLVARWCAESRADPGLSEALADALAERFFTAARAMLGN